MLDFEGLREDLEANGLGAWQEPLDGLLSGRMSGEAHGDLAKWREVVAALPPCVAPAAVLNQPVVTGGGCLPPDRPQLRRLLLELAPWRKGPFRVGDIHIDAEWRSDLKWARVELAISPLAGRLVLDVGSGNGYYALRMRGMGARTVFAIDPTLLYLVQHAAIRHFMPPLPVRMLPLRLHELPPVAAFDTVFSMGVLYHQRAPLEHLAQLRGSLRPDGELVLETLILPGAGPEAQTPERYARMRNVWHLPTETLLHEWLAEAGFAGARTIDISATTTLEQRRTEWMPFESLPEALDPEDPSKTIEGWPAPRRAVVVCHRPRP